MRLRSWAGFQISSSIRAVRWVAGTWLRFGRVPGAVAEHITIVPRQKLYYCFYAITDCSHPDMIVNLFVCQLC